MSDERDKRDDAYTCCGMACSTMLVSVGVGGSFAVNADLVVGVLAGVLAWCCCGVWWLLFAEWLDR